jgi:hypothetical protein
MGPRSTKKIAKVNNDIAKARKGLPGTTQQKRPLSLMCHLLMTNAASAHMNVPCRGEDPRKLWRRSTWRQPRASSLACYRKKRRRIVKRKPKEPRCDFYVSFSDQLETKNVYHSQL